LTVLLVRFFHIALTSNSLLWRVGIAEGVDPTQLILHQRGADSLSM
jgi:hypothetical protein